MKQKVTNKKIEKSFEAGSGSLHIPILGDIFPKLFSQEMKAASKYHIFTEKYRYEVSKKDYEKLKVGDAFDEKLSVFS